MMFGAILIIQMVNYGNHKKNKKFIFLFRSVIDCFITIDVYQLLQ